MTKITDVKTYLVEGRNRRRPGLLRWVLVQVETDEGIIGLGDATNWPHSDLIVAAFNCQREHVIGQNPFDIERLWRTMYGALGPLGPGGVQVSAICGIESACWDIIGQATGQPIYNLIGGRCWDKLRLYANAWFYDAAFTPDAYAKAAERVVEMGFTALKFDPLPTPLRGGMNRDISREEARYAYRMVEAVRKVVGPDIDIAVELHGRLNTPSAIRVCRMMEDLDPLFCEEPVPAENTAAMAKVAAAVNVPICAGEHLYARQGFREVLERQSVDIVMPDIVRTGGISESRKIAAMAETYYIPFAPHNPNSPVSSLVSLHTCIGVPNFLILEFFALGVPWRDEIIEPALKIENGYLIPPTGPGMGAKLNVDVATKHAG